MKELKKTTINGEQFFIISQVENLRPFFMTIVSPGNHWLFISSNGGVTAGRKNTEYSLFPYYTDDKIIESAENTGVKTIIRVETNQGFKIWEPFSVRSETVYSFTRNLYKSAHGNKIIFEEINHDLSLSFTYEWSTSDKYGFIKKTNLKNLSSHRQTLSIIDGFQNVLPYGIESEMQLRASNLADAYKRSELHIKSKLGIFALSSIIIDRAEPSEALKANTIFSLGLQSPTILLSSLQLSSFREGKDPYQENDIKGERGAYFIFEKSFSLDSRTKEWLFAANVNQSQSSVINLINEICSTDIITNIEADIKKGNDNLTQIVAASDGIQYSESFLNSTRHFSNTVFNIMRGGIFDNNYTIDKEDFKQYLRKTNIDIYTKEKDSLKDLPEKLTLFDLLKSSKASNNSDFIRLSLEYLPLKFSRRHGDPSRPWNRFNINTVSDIDGSKVLDYEGNWRDIFQNWEALAHSYPYFITGMILRFLNASTFDGYNPYRLTKYGFDWETIDKDDPWSYIGYWGDHQIVYLLKLLELSESYFPGSLEELLNKEIFVYANVPYKIKSYDLILNDPKDTIIFDHDLDKTIRENKESAGSDSTLLHYDNGQIVYVSFIEKILASVLSKISNFIVDEGIWLNTQRPEWNDANNALVGNGTSIVTLSYLRRYLIFTDQIITKTSEVEFKISKELHHYFTTVLNSLSDNKSILDGRVSANDKKRLLDILGRAASDYREAIYKKGFCGDKKFIYKKDLSKFIKDSILYIDHSLRSNMREDGLYNSYNLISVHRHSIESTSLEPMLEGQVAILSSGLLDNKESLNVLNALKNSSLYREDQNSYILYPNKDLKGFLERNIIPKELVEKSELLTQLLKSDNNPIIDMDINGQYHFKGDLRNASILKYHLNHLDIQYHQLLIKEENLILNIYEQVFSHKYFMGRSGTFFGYEGLGSIYWHMVSKLALAVIESAVSALKNNNLSEAHQLYNEYKEIKEGIGLNKSPELYGAFPVDPYSHTPYHRGAQQPGMTGQVKEDILSRFFELGIVVSDGKIHFHPDFIDEQEFLKSNKRVYYYNVASEIKEFELSENSIFLTKCQLPLIVQKGNKNLIEVHYKNGSTKIIEGLEIPESISNEIFSRSGIILQVNVKFKM